MTDESKQAQDVRNAALDEAARAVGAITWPAGNSAAGEMAADWTGDKLQEARDAILALKGTPAVAVNADGWLRQGSLLYRINDERSPSNRDEINVTMADGSRDSATRERRASALLAMLSNGAVAVNAEPVRAHIAMDPDASDRGALDPSKNEFEAACGKGFDYSTTKDAWGRIIYAAPFIRAMYDGFVLASNIAAPPAESAQPADIFGRAIYDAAVRLGIANEDHASLSVPQLLHLLECIEKTAAQPAQQSEPMNISPDGLDELLDTFPIAKLSIGADGKLKDASLYAPGLPPGDHDVFVSPDSFANLDEVVDAWLTVCREIGKFSPNFMQQEGNGIDCAISAIRRMAQAAPACRIPEEKPLPELMMASYHEAIGWNECRKAMLAAAPQAAQAAPVDADGELLNWLQEQLVDTIYLDDGRIIDVGGRHANRLLEALRAALAASKQGGAA